MYSDTREEGVAMLYLRTLQTQKGLHSRWEDDADSTTTNTMCVRVQLITMQAIGRLRGNERVTMSLKGLSFDGYWRC